MTGDQPGRSSGDDQRWLRYLASVADDAPPRDTLVKALARWEGPPGRALDLGAGQGRDTVHLLRHGWRVTAIDKSSAAIERVAGLCPAGLSDRLCVIEAAFEEIALPDGQDLINASFSLPFCAPDRFDALWADIERALRPGGLFCGHLLGPDDDWSAQGVVTETQDQIHKRFRAWTAMEIDTSQGPAATAKGRTKYWDLYKIVAVR